MKPFAFASLLVIAPVTLLAQFRIPIPRVPGVDVEVPIPGVEDIVDQEPAVSTSLLDAQTEIALLDDYTPQQPMPMIKLRRGDQGSFLLEPGVYAMEAQSYCLRAGTHAPGSGNGYLYAPLLGDRNEIIRHILENSVEYPSIPQRDIQVLIWGIIARTKLSDMPANIRATAEQLLSDRELRALNGGVLGMIPDELQREVISRLPSEARRVFQAEAEIRELLMEGTSSYEQLERIAVLAGEPPTGEGSRDVPSGRWSYHPDGYFVRYLPSGYTRTRIEVSVPEPTVVERDEQGRIIAIADEEGNRIETIYDDSIAPLTVPSDPTLVGYAFKSIRFIQIDPTQPGGTQEMEWSDTGWTFVTQDSVRQSSHPGSEIMAFGKQAIESVSPDRDNMLHAQAGDRYEEWQRRYDTAQEWQERVDYYRDRVEERTRPRSDADIDNLTDLGHYQEGIEAATRGSQGDRLDWIARHHERTANALEYAICVLEGGCSGDSGDVVEFNPADDVAVPANTARQRLGQSARPYPNSF
ncbi:MAG: hypothetical protein ACFE0J_10130 [Elainellaceae cyanobacterium]